MSKIFCLMGKSGSGKDTIFNKLSELTSLKPIILYTTRPKRQNEIDGREYYFIDKKQLEAYRDQKKIIEERVYYTVEGPWYYATIDDGQFTLNQHSLLIGTLEVYLTLVHYFGKDNVIPIYIHIDDDIRKRRLELRERQQKVPNYKELYRRFVADNKDFSKENLLEAGIHTYYINEHLEVCIEQILATIHQVLEESV